MSASATVLEATSLPAVPPPDESSATVLVVDDDADIRRQFCRFLSANFRVTCLEAGDGAAALTHLLCTSVDLVLLDLDMPVLDGIRTLETIRHTASLRALPVVLTTERPTERRIRTALGLGLATVLVKPPSEEALCARVRPMLAAYTRCRTSDRRRANPLDVRPDLWMLIVERDPDIRQLLSTTLSASVHVRATENEFAAMSACAVMAPDLIWLGETIGIWSRDELLRAVCTLANARRVRFVASLPKDQLPSAAASGHYAAVVRRTGDLAELESELVRILTPAAATRVLLRPDSRLVRSILESFADTGLAVTTAPAHQRIGLGRCIVGVAQIAVGGLAVTLELYASSQAVIELTRHTTHRGDDQIGHDEPLAVIRTGFRAWADLAASRLAVCGLAATVSDVRAHWQSEPIRTPNHRFQSSRHFVTGDGTPMVVTIGTT
jgi:DNA-binding response OmpR family regulator